MSEPGASQLVAAGSHALPALVWGIVALGFWRLLRRRRSGGPLPRIAALLTSLMALHYLLHTLAELTPTELGGRVPGLHTVLLVAMSLSLIGALALFRHLVPLLAVREEVPSRRWLTVHYGTAAVVGLVSTLTVFAPEGWTRLLLRERIDTLYVVVMMVLSGRAMYRLTRRRAWPRHFDVAFSATLVAALGVLGLTALLGLGDVLLDGVSIGSAGYPVHISRLLHTAFGLAFAAPFAVGMLGEVLRALVVTVVLLTVTALVYLRVPVLGAQLQDGEARQLLDVGAVVTLLLVAGPGRSWLQAAVDRVLLRHSRRCREELQEFLHTLTPELGALACCRRALAEVVRVMQLRGAAILLAGGRGAVACGSLPLEPLEAAWPRDAAAGALPARAFGFYDIRAAALREALAAAKVGRVVPVWSPRARWGHLFVSEGLLGRATRDEEHIQTLEAFAAQLARLLDASELLAQAAAVERSLAHAEKLAAIGEVTARIAHDIRNPVTAARSLAQQLARTPSALGDAEPAALILAELERVERQVADLLRFARREEPRLEPVDLSELTRATVEPFRARLEGTGVGVELELTAGVVAHADRERVRQVLVNLIENAADALAEARGQRRLCVAVLRADGTATVRLTDTGPGVPADALPHLFEPFFSLKAHGTGLGLAIARRTIEAHGGRITAAAGTGAGMTFEIALPLGSAPV